VPTEPTAGELNRYAAWQHPRVASVFSIPMATVQTKQDLIGRLRRHRGDLRRLGVQRLGLFGSFQRGESDPESDVDLLIEFAPGEKSFDNFMAVSFLLEEELGRSVELVTREALSPHLGPHILEDVEYVEIGD
jgi:predicted nucleotidyltransferase